MGLYHCKTLPQNKEEKFFSHSCSRLIIATFRWQYEDHYEFKFSELSTCCRFGGRKISKCACSELKTRTRSRPRTPIWRSLVTIKVQHKLKKLYSREKNSAKRGGISHFGKCHNTLCLSPQILHEHCFCFLLGLLYFPRETENNAYAKFEGTNKEYYGIFRSGLYPLPSDWPTRGGERGVVGCKTTASKIRMFLFYSKDLF